MLFMCLACPLMSLLPCMMCSKLCSQTTVCRRLHTCCNILIDDRFGLAPSHTMAFVLKPYSWNTCMVSNSVVSMNLALSPPALRNRAQWCHSKIRYTSRYWQGLDMEHMETRRQGVQTTSTMSRHGFWTHSPIRRSSHWNVHYPWWVLLFFSGVIPLLKVVWLSIYVMHYILSSKTGKVISAWGSEVWLGNNWGNVWTESSKGKSRSSPSSSRTRGILGLKANRCSLRQTCAALPPGPAESVWGRFLDPWEDHLPSKLHSCTNGKWVQVLYPLAEIPSWPRCRLVQEHVNLCTLGLSEGLLAMF